MELELTRRPPRTAVVTTFGGLWDGFSLCGVVRTQLRCFAAAGQEITLVTCNDCPPIDGFAQGAVDHARMPRLTVECDAVSPPDQTRFARAVVDVRNALRPVIAATEVAITHDIFLLHQNLAYNAACRHLAAEFPWVRWLHWIHSAPAGVQQDYPMSDPRRLMHSPVRNARFVYPNAAERGLVARQFAMPEASVAVVPHPFDMADEFGMHPLSRAIADRLDMWSPEIVVFYPGRIDRGKQVDCAIRLVAALKARGRTVRFVIAGFFASGPERALERDDLRNLGRSLGLDEDELCFIHDLAGDPALGPHDPEALRSEVPHRVVMDLFRLTTLYIHASVSETFSLVTQEAAASGALLVLNDNAPAMREIYGPDAIWLSFGSPYQLPDHPDGTDAYFAHAAEAVLARLESETTLRQRTRIRRLCGPAAVFSRHLAPLLAEGDPATEGAVA